MTPAEFVRKWKPVTLTERAAAQEHFIDLCRLLGHPTPAEDDPLGDHFAFEKGVTKTGGGEGFADVWKRGFFAWEYKKRKVSLDKALEQLVRYAAALENPPLQVACDTERFLIRTAWTNAVPAEYEILLDDIADPAKLDILHSIFFAPEKLRPSQTRTGLTREAADKFSTIATRLQGAGTPEEIAHFVNQLVFCFFANSAELLPKGFFPKLLKRCSERPQRARDYFNQLFAAMETGGEFDLTDIAWFNGGLFDGRRALALDAGDIGLLQAAASLDWSQIDPTIFGTLFERFLDPQKRKQIGAHYTDRDKIMMIVEPVILRPLRAEWYVARTEMEAVLAGRGKPPKGMRRRLPMTLEQTAAEEVRARYIERLKRVSILDPACGSGNFLYLALQGVKDLENRANLESEALGLPPRVNEVGPEILHGIEINPVAAELARTAIWIGEIQWRRRNGIYYDPPPILRKLDTIECRDALMEKREPSPLAGEGREGGRNEGPGLHPSPTPDPSPQGGGEWREARWPAAEFIVGNPPFLGGKLLRKGLGDQIVEALFQVYARRVPPEADLVTYWFEKARAQIKLQRAKRVGLVATNSIRGGVNRRVLEHIAEDPSIVDAWSDEPWIVEGAAVRVSLVCFWAGDGQAKRLNGNAVSEIFADLTAGATDLTKAKPLASNRALMSQGIKFGGPFELADHQARELLVASLNPNGRGNSDVLHLWTNGDSLIEGRGRLWCIDFGTMSEADAALYEAPFQWLKLAFERENDRRAANEERRLRQNEPRSARLWWIHQRSRNRLRAKLNNLSHYIAKLEVAKHSVLCRVDAKIVPSGSVYVVARDDDTTFGILHSRFHQAWSLRLGTSLEDRPRYTPTTTFETFPFPEGLTPNVPAADYVNDPRALAIAKAAKRLDELRNAWLNPPDLIVVELEVTPTAAPGDEPVRYLDRILPRNAEAEAKLKKRTLTKLYNERPQWLDDAHRDLDAAVAAAYGWPADISEEDGLAKLLGLNLQRAADQEGPAPSSRRVTSPLSEGRHRRKPAREEGEMTAADRVVPLVGREAFARISEVEGIRLSDESQAMLADFDRRGLSAEERRAAIIERFRRDAAE